MNQPDRRAAIALRLTQAQDAHAQYEETDLHGEYDKAWAEWYAQYLLAHGWNELYTRVWTEPELTDALRQADVAHRANAPHEAWSEYYAGRLDREP